MQHRDILSDQVPDIRDYRFPLPAMLHRVREMTIVDGNDRIACTLSTPECSKESSHCVIVIHGLGAHRNSGFSRRVEAQCLGAGVACLRLGLRHQDPDSSGALEQYTLAAGTSDVLASYELLTKTLEYRRISLVAASFGAQPALYAASSMPHLSGLVLNVPLTDGCQSLLEQLPVALLDQWQRHGRLSMEIGNGVNAELGYGLVQEAKTLSAVPDYSYIQVPVYAIFAGSDEYLPCEANRDALRSSGGPQHFAVLPEVGHYPRSFEHKSTLFGVFDSFLKDHLDSVAAGLD